MKDLKINIESNNYWLPYKEWKAMEDWYNLKVQEVFPEWLIKFCIDGDNNRNKDNSNT